MNALISTIKNSLSYYIEQAKSGEEVIILDRDIPVARLSRFTAHSHDEASKQQYLNALVRDGIIARASSPLANSNANEIYEPPTAGVAQEKQQSHLLNQEIKNLSLVDLLLTERSESI